MIEILAQYAVNKEHFSDEETYDNLYIGWCLFSLAASIIAAYLSWSCNEKSNYPLSVKVVCALNAFSWGIFYIIYYFLFQVGKTCSKFKVCTSCSKNQLVKVKSKKLVDLDSDSYSLPVQKSNSFKTSMIKSLMISPSPSPSSL